MNTPLIHNNGDKVYKMLNPYLSGLAYGISKPRNNDVTCNDKFAVGVHVYRQMKQRYSTCHSVGLKGLIVLKTQ